MLNDYINILKRIVNESRNPNRNVVTSMNINDFEPPIFRQLFYPIGKRKRIIPIIKDSRPGTYTPEL